MTDDSARVQILSQLTEDLTGLWELAATPAAPAMGVLISELDSLIDAEMVAIYSGTEFASEEIRLDKAQSHAAIRNRNFWDWDAPEKGPHIRALATQAGVDWYYAQRQ